MFYKFNMEIQYKGLYQIKLGFLLKLYVIGLVNMKKIWIRIRRKKQLKDLLSDREKILLGVLYYFFLYDFEYNVNYISEMMQKLVNLFIF